jgi:cytochrome P450
MIRSRSSFSARLLHTIFRTPLPRYAGFTLVEAGSHPSAALVLSLVFVLASYPEYQERAREEIYSVVGRGRLPELDDFKKMPFVDALIKEIIRMRPEFPMGTPHFTTQDLHASSYLALILPWVYRRHAV